MERKKKLIIAILGTPGVGKTTFAKKLGKKLGLEVIEANKIIEEKKLYSGLDKFKTKIVKLKEFEKEANKMAKEKGSFIIEGHILSDIKIKNAIAIVLREHLNTIYKRLKKRGYPYEKIFENLESEATDYSGITAERNYKKVYEFLSSDKNLTEKVIKAIKGEKIRKEKVELLEELLNFIMKSSQ